MAQPVDTLRGHLAAVVALDRRSPCGLADMTAVADSDLVALVPAVQALTAASQGLLALVAWEIAARDGGRAEAPLAKRFGFRTAAGLVAARGNLPYSDAHRLVDVGQVIRPTDHGAEPERPHIAEAVLAGDLALSVAATIDRTLEALRDRLDAHELDVLEAALVEQAVSGETTVQQFLRECARLLDREDPGGSADRDEVLRSKASYRETELSNGLLRIVAELDPERAAFYRAAVTARTNPQRSGALAAVDDSTAEGDDRGGASKSGPSAPQPDPMVRKLDAFTAILRDDLARADGDQAGVATTVLVRIDLQDLLNGTGSATIDGIDTPVSAATARRMAVEADLIPQVFGGRSQLLDQGEARRLYSRAQRYAIWAEHDGCAFPGCDLPLSMTQIHPPRRTAVTPHGGGAPEPAPWAPGSWATRHRHRHGTDLGNGIPLCGFHNRLMERGWGLHLDEDRTPWFTPPEILDRRRTPLRGSHRTHRRAA